MQQLRPAVRQRRHQRSERREGHTVLALITRSRSLSVVTSWPSPLTASRLALSSMARLVRLVGTRAAAAARAMEGEGTAVAVAGLPVLLQPLRPKRSKAAKAAKLNSKKNSRAHKPALTAEAP